MSEYEGVQRGSLKLKGSAGVVKKKKKKSKDKDKEKQLIQLTMTSDKKESSLRSPPIETRTKAELAYIRAQEKRAADTLVEKASKTHKERIMEFNEKLDSLTEHFDIPKVSWTK